MQTWWVFYIFIYLLLNMYFLLFLIISFGHQQIKIRNKKQRLFILLISNKQGHTHTRIYTHTYTHIFYFFVSFTPKLVYLIFFIHNFIDMEMGMLCWLYIDGLAYIFFFVAIKLANQTNIKNERTFILHCCLICVFLNDFVLVKCVVYHNSFSPFLKLGEYHCFPLNSMLKINISKLNLHKNSVSSWNPNQ